MVIIVVVITGGDINEVILMEVSSDNVTKVVAVLLWMMVLVSLAKNMVI